MDSVNKLVVLFILKSGCCTKGKCHWINFYYKGTAAKDFCFIQIFPSAQTPKTRTLKSGLLLGRPDVVYALKCLNVNCSLFLK